MLVKQGWIGTWQLLGTSLTSSPLLFDIFEIVFTHPPYLHVEVKLWQLLQLLIRLLLGELMLLTAAAAILSVLLPLLTLQLGLLSLLWMLLLQLLLQLLLSLLLWLLHM